MTQLRQKMIEDLQLRGYSPGTQTMYVRAVRQLAEHYAKGPDQISEDEVRQYFLYLTNEKKVSRSTSTIALCAVKFFYEYTLQRNWPTLDLVRPGKEQKLPMVLSVEEVRHLLSTVRKPHYRVCLNTLYACGLRVSEGRTLQIGDIDSARMTYTYAAPKAKKNAIFPYPRAHSPCCVRTGRPIAIQLGSFPRNRVQNQHQSRPPNHRIIRVWPMH